ncbi:cation-transporting P-type ATPase [Flavobacterium sp. XS2P14]
MLHNKFKIKGLTTAEVNRARKKYGENKTAYKKTICF